MRTSKLILRVHGTILILVTFLLTTIGGLSYWYESGIYGDMLAKEPIGYIGLFQAYLLMMVIGITLWWGSFQERPHCFHWLGLAAHVPPLLANLIFWDMIASYGIPHSGLFLHVGMMILEGFGMRMGKKKAHRGKR